MIEPCIILTEEQAEDWAVCGIPILPGIVCAGYMSEFQAKETAHRIGCCFSWVDLNAVLFG